MAPSILISKHLVLINSASAVCAQLIRLFFVAWVYQYLLARISTEEFALFPLVASIMVIGPFMTSFITSGIARFAVFAAAKGRGRDVTRIITSIFPVALIGALVFLLAGGVFAWKIGSILTVPPDRIREAQVMLGLLVFGFAWRVALLPLGVGFHITQRFVLFNMIGVAREIVRLGLLFALLFGLGPRVLWVVLASEITSLVSLIVVTAVSMRIVPQLRIVPGLFAWSKIKELLSFGVWTTMGQLTLMINRGADVILLNELATPLDVTNFHVGMEFERQIRGMTTMASAPAQPALTALHALEDRERLGNAFLQGGRLGLWACGIVAVPLIVLRHQIVDLYVGAEFGTMGLVMLLSLCAYPFSYSTIMLPQLAVATARVRRFFLGALVTQLINLALTLYLVGVMKLGAVGSALGTFVMTIVSHVLYFWPLGLSMAGVRPRRFAAQVLAAGLTPALAAFIVMASLLALREPGSWVMVGLYSGLGAAAYFLVLIRFCLQKDERLLVARLLKSLRKRPESAQTP